MTTAQVEAEKEQAPQMKEAGKRILDVLNFVKEGDWSFEDGQEEIKKIAQELAGE